MRIIVDEQGHKYWVAEDSNKEIHTQFGVIQKEDVLAAKPGSAIKTHKGVKFTVLEPTFVDYFEDLKRGPAIVLLKDAGIISAYTGIGPGSKVVEAGSGTGALTCYLANLVRPAKLYSYERRIEFMELAKENVADFGLSEFVVFKNKDISKGIAEKDVDVIVLDLPEPWTVVKHAEKALKAGGFLVSYIPTINQVQRLHEELAKSKLKVIKTSSVEEKEWKVGAATRPLSMQLCHTAFLVFSRKI
jgi:tRNA (adenine57-N1/adenine58-N1)-methyltransferase